MPIRRSYLGSRPHRRPPPPGTQPSRQKESSDLRLNSEKRHGELVSFLIHSKTFCRSLYFHASRALLFELAVMGLVVDQEEFSESRETPVDQGAGSVTKQ
eukprot:92971-Amphidinium_carterae.1